MNNIICRFVQVFCTSFPTFRRLFQFTFSAPALQHLKLHIICPWHRSETKFNKVCVSGMRGITAAVFSGFNSTVTLLCGYLVCWPVNWRMSCWPWNNSVKERQSLFSGTSIVTGLMKVWVLQYESFVLFTPQIKLTSVNSSQVYHCVCHEEKFNKVKVSSLTRDYFSSTRSVAVYYIHLLVAMPDGNWKSPIQDVNDEFQEHFSLSFTRKRCERG